MRIQHNVMAMNAYRNYNNNTSALAKNLERLSSGYKINRAGDDAAGLAISEKMRAQITGLEAAQKNVKDGTSLVNTAEGAMQEIQDMLNRMVYLATQSSNGTYDNQTDRKALQDELDQLRSEINRIADSANFNGIKLLDGSLDDGKDLTVTSLDLPPVGDILGTDTVLHKEVTAQTTGSSWDINLANLSALKMPAADGGPSSLTVKIGDNTYTVDLKNSSADETATNIATDIVNALNGETFVDANGNEFIFSKTAKTTADTINISSNGNVISFAQGGIPSDEENVLLTPSAVSLSISNGKFGGAIDNGQDYNVSATNQVQVTLDSPKSRLASTYLKLTSDMVQDGATLRLGDDTYIFTADPANYGGDATTVDISDLDTSTADGLNKALIRLTEQANGNALYSVGYDGGRITLTEKETHTYNATTGEPQDDYNLKTLKGIKKSIGFQGVTKTGAALSLQIGDTSDSFNQLKVSVGDMHVDAMGIQNISIADQKGAQAAVQTIKEAINYVSSVRGTLGAISNRLDHTANNLSVMAENITDAESAIRDTDIAEEMMSYTKNNILVQSAQAMLAQANQVPQGVLQLLQ